MASEKDGISGQNVVVKLDGDHTSANNAAGSSKDITSGKSDDGSNSGAVPSARSSGSPSARGVKGNPQIEIMILLMVLAIRVEIHI
jgi:hypothetical protein